MVDWTQMLKNLSNSLVSVEQFILGIFYIIGLSFLISGVLGLMHFGNRMQADSGEKKEALLKIFTGTAFIGLGHFTIPILLQTFFGSVNSSDFGVKTANLDLFFAVKRIVQLAGIIWIGLGIHLLIRDDQSPRSKSFKGLTYLVAGILAMNYEYASKVLNYLFSLVMQLFK